MRTLSAFVTQETLCKPVLAREPATQPASFRSSQSDLLDQYRRVRRFSEQLCQTLEPEDFVIQRWRFTTEFTCGGGGGAPQMGQS